MLIIIKKTHPIEVYTLTQNKTGFGEFDYLHKRNIPAVNVVWAAMGKQN
jgi:hypothetical protein